MKTFRTLLILATLLLGDGLLLAVKGQGEPTVQEKASMLQRMALLEQGRFVLRGTVQDETGAGLDDVQLLVTKTKGGGVFQEARSEQERHVVNREFRLDYTACLSVKLTFTRAGYYPSVMLFNYTEPQVTENQLMGQEPMPSPMVERNDIKVVLEKRGNTVKLRDYTEVLEYETSGRGTVMDLDRSNADGSSLVRVANVHETSQLPTNAVYIIADQEENQRIAIVERSRTNSSVVDVLPRRLRLGMRTQNGGLLKILHDPTRRLSSQTRLAPETGYNQELIVLPDDFIEGGAKGGPVFYFRAADKFGKGDTGWVEVNATRSLVQLRVRFRVQPDSSRNLETEPEAYETVITQTTQPVLGDVTSPTMAVLGANPVTIECGGVYADAGATATDNKDGDITARIVVENKVDTPKVGTYQVIYRVSDAAGNAATATRTVKVVYKFDGFLPPIGGADATGGTYDKPVRTFKLGSTVPVKFQISCGGAAVKDGAHTLQVIKYNNATTAAEPIDATPTDAATTGNQFKLTGDEWHFNLDTKATSMTTGTWQLKATLSDGSTHLVWIALK